MTRKIILALALFGAAGGVNAAGATSKPRLIVNIVVSQMPYDYLRQFSPNFGDGGFRRFASQGLNFSQASYTFSKTTTPATLASLTTGAYPDMHGIVADRWIDFTTNRTISLIDDERVSGLACDAGCGRYSPANLLLPTLGDKLMAESPGSRVVTIALDPLSAVVLGGRSRDVYWMDDTRGNWVSSTAYMSSLPQWVASYNQSHTAENMLGFRWTPFIHPEKYLYDKHTAIDVEWAAGRGSSAQSSAKASGGKQSYASLLKTPVGNMLVTDMARQVITYEGLGKGKGGATDILNICFDTPRYVGEKYGSRSMEVEDVFYRLDDDIAEMVNFIKAQMPTQSVLFVLTSDHGTNLQGGEQERFNSDMFRLLVNGLLSSQYGRQEWAVGFIDGELYLNHDVILSQNLDLAQLQAKVASFAVQFSGVSHALTGSAMGGGYFGSGYARMMQRSYYPKRSGDVMLNLMPGWTVDRDKVLSCSGSMYDYDAHVPLMLLGTAIPAGEVRTPVDMCALAPTLARILGISPPMAPETPLVDQILDCYENR